MRLVRIQRPEPIRGRRLRQDTSPSSWETRVQIPSAAPICARSTTGQCAGLRIWAVEVRVLPCAPVHQGVGEPGRPCLPWKQETGGSNPPTLTNSGLQAPVARAERHRSSKSANAGSNPVWSSTHSVFHGRVAQRMSADFLHRRMHVRIVSRSPTWRVNWAGAQRRLLSDRPARR
jgi:hypothetical protein